MPFSPSGVYSVPSGTFAEVGTEISSEAYNALLTDLEASLSELLLKSGAVPMEADLNLGAKQVRNMAAGTAPTDGLRYDQAFPRIQTQWISNLEANIATEDVEGPQWDLLTSNMVALTGAGNVANFGTQIKGPWFVRATTSGVVLLHSTLLRCPGGVNYAVPDQGGFMLIPFSLTNNSVPNAYKVLAFI